MDEETVETPVTHLIARSLLELRVGLSGHCVL
jgi:hypothetical protein